MHGEFSEAQVITCDVADASAEVNENDALVLVGDRTVRVADQDGEDWHGLAQGPPKSKPGGGEYVAVELKGARNGRVAAQYDETNDGNADTATEAPATLVPNGNGGELRPTRDGESGASGLDGVLLAAPGGDGHGLVLIR